MPELVAYMPYCNQYLPILSLKLDRVHQNCYWCNVCAHAQLLCCVRLFVTLWTVAHQALLSMGSSSLEYWVSSLEWWVAISFSRGVFLSKGLNPCLLCLLHWQAGSLPVAPPGKPNVCVCVCVCVCVYPLFEVIYLQWDSNLTILFKRHGTLSIITLGNGGGYSSTVCIQ